MTDLHAPDPMGKAAHAAAILASRFDYRLLVAASPTMSREQRAEHLRQALEQWPRLCRAMADLETAAPNMARLAADEDAKLVDFVESRR